MKVLFLDDMEERHQKFQEAAKSKGWTANHCVSYDTFVTAMIQHWDHDVLFLDYDLSVEDIMCDPDGVTETKTGTDVAKWLVKNCKGQKMEIVLHSLNPGGVTRMKDILTDAGFTVHAIPFIHLPQVLNCHHEWQRRTKNKMFCPVCRVAAPAENTPRFLLD